MSGPSESESFDVQPTHSLALPRPGGGSSSSSSARFGNPEEQPLNGLNSTDLDVAGGAVRRASTLPSFSTPGGSLGSRTTSLAAFELAPLPKPIKTLYEHLRTPYYYSLLSIVCHVLAIAASLASYFLPWTYVSVSTFAPPLQTINLEFSVGSVRYTCLGEFCEPREFRDTYYNFMVFWYRQINNGGFAPYPNIPLASSEPGMSSTALCAIGMFFAIFSILTTAANAAAMKRLVMSLPAYAPNQHWTVRRCPPPGTWFTLARALAYNATAFTCHALACLLVWGSTPTYLNQLLGLNALLPWTNGVIPAPNFGWGSYLGGAGGCLYLAAMLLAIKSKMLLRAGALADRGSKYTLVGVLGSSEASHWCC